MAETKEKLKVVLFSGGSGTGSISDALLKYPDIELTMLVNAYDDGKSTGLLRRFIPGMLGPSDIRKVVSSLLRHNDDRSSQALRFILEYRLPKDIASGDALTLLNQLIDWQVSSDSDHEILIAKENISLAQMRLVSRFLKAFVDYYQETAKQKSWFTFADNSLGNLLFGGCYLLSGQDFNQAIANFCDFAEVGNGVVNITQGENLVLTALKENGQYLFDEASIVGPQDASRIEEIFLLPNYIDPKELENASNMAEKIKRLRDREILPLLSQKADIALRQADIIIYGPGTQHSSLYPSYLTVGVAEAIQSNKRAEKIFIANIARDYDILDADAAMLVKGFMANMERKGAYPVKSQHVVTRFFFQKPESQTSADYVPFAAGKFEHSLEKVVWIDLEGDKGKHSGGRTVSELLLVVEEQLRKKIRHVPHKVSIVVPALNEENTIKQVLHDLREVQFPDLGLEKEIIVVDGGSSDETFTIASNEPGIRTYQLTGKGGRGLALRLGLEKARGEIIVFFPSDGEYFVQDITRIVTPLLNQEFPVVFGSRAFQTNDLSGTLQRIYGNKGLMFLVSKYGGMLLSIMTLVFCQRYIGDPLTSLKGFNARSFRGMDFRRMGVDFDMELIAKLARAKYPILEVPVSYKARTVSQGKKITLGDGVKCLISLIRFSRYKPKVKKAIVSIYRQEPQATTIKA